MKIFEINKDIPIPIGNPCSIYPWRDLEIGDSFFVPNKNSGSFGSVIFSAKKRTGRNFTSRSVIENGEHGVRIWRIEDKGLPKK